MTTLQLNLTQYAILDHAIQHTGGRIDWFPDNINGGARQKVLDGLFRRALITPGHPGWWVTAESYDALGYPRPQQTYLPIAGNVETTMIAPAAEADTRTEREGAMVSEPVVAPVAHDEVSRPRRDHSKQAMVIRLLQRPEGATLAQICEVTGWQAHTVRGLFAGALKKKLGLNLVSDKLAGSDRVYRIA